MTKAPPNPGGASLVHAAAGVGEVRSSNPPPSTANAGHAPQLPLTTTLTPAGTPVTTPERVNRGGRYTLYFTHHSAGSSNESGEYNTRSGRPASGTWNAI